MLPDMLKKFEHCLMVVVPTTNRFAEGLNWVRLDGALPGRPVINTVVRNVGDVFGEANVTIRADDSAQLAEASEAVGFDQAEYERHQAACRAIREQLPDPALYWRNVTHQSALSLLTRP